MKENRLIFWIIFVVLVLDQALKIWVKTSFEWQETIYMFGQEWAQLRFIENNGMAFGMEFGGRTGKIFLSLFRIVAVVFLFYILRRMVREGVKRGVQVCFALILAGAIGNIIDSTFYGLLFDRGLQINHHLMHSYPYSGVAQLNLEGYSPLFMGAVVDMFYFPLIDSQWPDWVPLLGGKRLHFFGPIFNLADSAISVGVISLLLFYRSYFAVSNSKKEEELSPKDERDSGPQAEQVSQI